MAKPGGNVTGLTAISPDLSGKRLELLLAVVPKVNQIAALWYPSQWDDLEVTQTRAAAAKLGVSIQPAQVKTPDDFKNASESIKNRSRALIIIQGGSQDISELS